MAQIVATIKIMPESPETDLSLIQNKAEEEIKKFAGDTEIKAEQEPIAFGLKALKIIFVMDESKGSIETLEESIKKIDGVNSVEVVDVRRAIG
ncbi:MAG: elongation factor 1-beta [Nanoarchaeota archaeon]|nr:elongation factor 1-beta [Nanoarchaeota archaeon]